MAVHGAWRDIPQNVKDKLTAKSKEADVLWKYGKQLQEKAMDQVLDGCDVVACTCTGAGDRSLIGREFAMVAVDEASQATAPATLIPLTRLGIKKVILVGDPLQLPPTVTLHPVCTPSSFRRLV
jgi:superfamily I DNA and/or RNA helicase